MKHGRAWGILIVLAALAPLGIIAAGGAWGEWDLAGIKARVGYVPEGMRKASSEARAIPLKDYAVPGLERSVWHERLGTVITALAGAGSTALVSYMIARMAKHDGRS
jgi:hypothetical protein